MKTIKKGSRGEDVKMLQRALHLVDDGVFGDLTHEVLVAYQRERGLVADGVAGPKTWELLKKELVIAPNNLTKVSKRKITDLVIHCTASREGVPLTVEQIRKEHMKPKSKGGNGWSDIGYHIVIYQNGSIHDGRDVDLVGAHVSGYNKNSIGIVYVGGLDKNGKPADTRTEAQKESLAYVIRNLLRNYPNARVRGHRDFSPDKNGDGIISPCEWIKECPCFEVKEEF